MDSVALAAVQKKTDVSSPSRATAMKARTTTAVPPMATALSSLPCSSLAMDREALLIQKIIQVTNATAMIDMTPPKRSWASKERLAEVNSSSAPTATLRTTARPTPAHTKRTWLCRPVRTR